MAERRLIFRVHAIQRMSQRWISEVDVRDVLENGEVIEEYPEGGRLILGFCDNRPIHVVAEDRTDAPETIIITLYEPDPGQWDSTFRRRRVR